MKQTGGAQLACISTLRSEETFRCSLSSVPPHSLLLLSFVSVSAQTTGIQNSPYSATEKTTLVQKLADGTTITRESTATEARDSQGRTVRTTTMKGMGGRNTTNATVIDPVARTITYWSSLAKEATTMHMPEPRKGSQSGTVLMSSGPSAVGVATLGNLPMVAISSEAVTLPGDSSVKPAGKLTDSAVRQSLESMPRESEPQPPTQSAIWATTDPSSTCERYGQPPI
jgi:hypothetical protein